MVIKQRKISTDEPCAESPRAESPAPAARAASNRRLGTGRTCVSWTQVLAAMVQINVQSCVTRSP